MINYRRIYDTLIMLRADSDEETRPYVASLLDRVWEDQRRSMACRPDPTPRLPPVDLDDGFGF